MLCRDLDDDYCAPQYVFYAFLLSRIILAATILRFLITVATSLRRDTSRKLLERFFVEEKNFCAATSLNVIFTIANCVCVARVRERSLAIILDDTAICISYMICAICYGWPGLRAKTQAYVISIGGEVGSAAGIAGMLGSQKPADVIRVSKSCFRCVFADQILKEDIMSNVPDPALSAKTVPAQLGTVDVFLSHSWVRHF